MENIFNFNYINSFDSFSNISLIIYSLLLFSIGSFASSIIFRISLNIENKDKNISIIYPRSFCPKCKSTIKLINLIPVLGFLFQKGNCSMCNSKISPFYPITEISFFLFGMGVAYVYGLGIFSFFLLLIFFLFYVLFILDWRFYHLPFSINILLIISGFIGNSFFNIFVGDISLFFKLSPLLFSLYGFLIGYFSLWIVNLVFKLIYKVDGIGGGDFILFGALGALFGPFALAMILFLGSLSGCIFFLLFRKKFKSQIPLGSCLIFSSILYFLIKNVELFSFLLVL
ncbi:MAG: prepilin peptidase [Gammaproteobacteria bacterium]|nr:prepilin peptidase [Gammaproteobacteria bacterium]